jgi:hypothetical protein
MSDLNALLEQIPVGDIAKQLGIDEDTAQAAVKQVLPGLVGGLQANAASGGGASLEKALDTHRSKTINSLADVDTEDGKKIVKNVFGDNTDKVAAKLADNEPKSNVTMDIIQKVLPIVAPIVLSFIATQIFKPKAEEKDTKAASSDGGLDLGGLLGGLLGGGSGSSGGGIDIGGLLGGLLGGGKK